MQDHESKLLCESSPRKNRVLFDVRFFDCYYNTIVSSSPRYTNIHHNTTMVLLLQSLVNPSPLESSLKAAGDVVIVKDRLLYTHSSQNPEKRFFLKGIAYPDAPPPQPIVGAKEQPTVNYNATAWIAVLKQLRQAMPATALNTVRVYRMDPLEMDYGEFFDAAAEMGFYVIVPLTATSGGAVLDRSKEPPHCYTFELYEFGTKALLEYLKYPNVIAGMIGNEVMNNRESWQAAPCVKAYARDLKLFMKDLNKQIQSDSSLAQRFAKRITETNELLPLPLSYACQHSGIGAALNSEDTIRLSLDYLTCDVSTQDQEDGVGSYGIDILGVNIESWCATGNTFRYNEDGTEGTYYRLWKSLRDGVDVPLVFSEMGCSHYQFNKDTPALRTPEGTRDWKQIPIVLNEMSDSWSGFCAYAYDGNPLFDMMEGGPWNGKDVLSPSKDFTNFQSELILATSGDYGDSGSHTKQIESGVAGGLHKLPMQNGGVMEAYYKSLKEDGEVPLCPKVEEAFHQTTSLELHNLEKMPSHFTSEYVKGVELHVLFLGVLLVILAVATLLWRRPWARRSSYQSLG